jgi:GNAT superfamily N-acetyltransferase
MAGIRVADSSDAPGVVGVMTLAFASDPACQFLFPDPVQYLTFFPDFVRLYGGRAFDHGGAHVIAGHGGAAMWLPPDVYPDDEALEKLIERSVAPAAMPEVLAVLAAMASHHPQEPHWFLPLIGIDPRQLGQGHGMALMTYGVEACDRDGRPAHLDSSHPGNIPFYERLGFELLTTIEIGGHPPMYPMRRHPR